MSAEPVRRVEEVIDRIYDPCSVAAENPISLIDMGLVRGWSVDESRRLLEVTMCVTSAWSARGKQKFPQGREVTIAVTAVRPRQWKGLICA